MMSVPATGLEDTFMRLVAMENGPIKIGNLKAWWPFLSYAKAAFQRQAGPPQRTFLK